MHPLGSSQALTDSEVRQLWEAALHILARVGVEVQHPAIIGVLADHGAKVDAGRQRVTFPAAWVEAFVAASDKAPPADQVRYHTGGYTQYYMPPGTRDVVPQTLESTAFGMRLCDYLDQVDTVPIVGNPSDVPPPVAPMYMRLLAWREVAAKPSGADVVWDPRICPYLVEMGEVMASARGGKAADYIGFTSQLISPLRFAREQAEVFLWFWERGLPASVGTLLSAGGTAPATLAGAVALQIAESLFCNFIDRLFYGRQGFHLYCSTTVLDMQRAVFHYGRPELGLTHLAVGQVARHVGASFSANSFLGDAKVPSCEAGMEKAINAIPAIMAGAETIGCLGLLSVDEYFSPIQMVIDNEYAGALRRLARGFEINEETLALDLIEEVGPGGVYTGTEHTARHYRQEHWQPRIFSRAMYNAWQEADGKTDVDKALDVCRHVQANHHPRGISEGTEQQLLDIIHRAEKELCGSG